MREEGLSAPKAVDKLYRDYHFFNWQEWVKVRRAVLAELAHHSNAVQRAQATPTQKKRRRTKRTAQLRLAL
jgi:hypothetical protein